MYRIENCLQEQDKSYRNAQKRASCCTTSMRQNSLSGHIRSFGKKLIASRTNRIVMPQRRCVIRRRLDKSKPYWQIDLLMCLTAPLCHHQIFLDQLFQLHFTGVLNLNFPANVFFVRKIEIAFSKISDDDRAA